jgi:hypothetical protein
MKRNSSWLVALVVVVGLLTASTADAQKKQFNDYVNQLQKNMDKWFERMGEGSCQVNLSDSADGDGQDVEMLFTMPLERFEFFAPIAAMEAASLNQRFKILIIWLRHKRTNKVARIYFRDAQPLSKKYLANYRNADGIIELAEDLKKEIRWQ